VITRHVTFPCGEIDLEGELQLPANSSNFPIVIVCHPHPQYGGDMYNNVVEIICEALLQNSIAAFRFNFRGVGNSGGRFGGGIGEREDVKAALDFIAGTTSIDSSRIGLAGYSFGGSVVLPVALEDKRVQLLALVSPALREKDWENLKSYPQPKCIFVGSNDTIIGFSRIQQYFDDADYFHTIVGADHFWQGYEEELIKKLVPFFGRNLHKN
jgi:uncharacterized protein